MSGRDSEVLTEKVAGLIVEAKRIIVFTGAGISTESGIPDFRGKDGIWNKYDPDDFTIQKFVARPEVRKMQWKLLEEGGLVKEAKPNAAHYAIVELERLGKLDCVITQNIDNLHQVAGNTPEIVFELHGNMQFVRCLGCNKRFPMAEIIVRVEKEGIPECEHCGGMLKPDAVFFGEALPQGVLNEAARRASLCDLCIVIGSTLIVYPAAYIPMYARDAGARLVIINLGSTPMDAQAAVRIDGRAGETMEKVLAHVKKRMGK
ncbi:MAG: NAD-dependent deacylase [Dehalococcoidia bacterium]|nr:NAD-dependent deacylase [Dehalococcoidia bacterium]MDD5493399.1 NAD-dependent deacylase [Dehalococcoidia bacterium]